MRLANIYIEHPTLSLDQCFSYRYTQEELQPGMRVWVPFAHQRLVGFVDSLSEISEEEAARLPYQIREVLESVRQSVERPKEFLRENKEVIDRYLAFKASAEYRGSPLAGMLELAREFNSASGYYDVFIPAMKELSPAYAEYHRQVELANERLLAEYPQLADASGQERSLE